MSEEKRDYPERCSYEKNALRKQIAKEILDIDKGYILKHHPHLRFQTLTFLDVQTICAAVALRATQ